MQRSLWKGAISFGLVHIPVQMFSAEDKSKSLDLTMLDKRDFAPIGYKRVNKDTGREVDWDDIVKGYEYEKDHFVVLSPEDLRRANVEATQTIDILAFVDGAEVPVVYYEQPYYLTPDKGGDKVYALLREALTRSGMVGIAQVVVRARQHLVALLPMGDMIVMNTLRYQDELKPADDFELPRSNSRKLALQEKEVEMALALVKGMAGAFEPEQYHDTYREDVMTVVQRKIKAKQTRLITEPEPEEEAPARGDNIVDLMALLRESVNSRGAKKPAAKAAAKKAAPAAAKKARARA
ncbi:MAG: Ku protein [Noviherbaspirillum sp.]